MMRTVWVVNRELSGLQSVETDPRIDSVNILGAPRDFWNTMWRINFLAQKRLYPEHSSYYPAAQLDGSWDLQSLTGPGEPISGDGVLLVGGLDPRDTIRLNREFLLIQTNNRVRMRYGPGWYPSDGELRWMGNDSASGELHLTVNAEREQMSLNVEYLGMEPS